MEYREFKRVDFQGVASSLHQAPQDGLGEVVLAGRSNVGKSSLINALTNRRSLAKVSSTPGKTQLVVYFKINEAFYLTDLPGYGYTATGRKRREAFGALADQYFQAERPISLVLLLVDIRHEPSAQDRLMYDFLMSRGQDFAIVLTKCDKLSRAQVLRQQQLIIKSLKPDPEIPIYAISSSAKLGIGQLREMILERMMPAVEEGAEG